MSAEILGAGALIAPADTALAPFRAAVGGVTVRFGAGCLAELGQEARRIGARRALLVTDAGVAAAGHVERALETLAAAGVAVEVFAEVPENPTGASLAPGAERCRQVDADLLVAVGGGSALDAAKGINFLATQGGVMEDYWGHGKANRAMLPAIGVPTTAGTGSDAQSYAVLNHTEKEEPGDRHGRKMACGDDKARFRTILLDPELAVTAPRAVRASAGMDALSHAVESLVTKRGNALSQLYAVGAWNLLEPAFEEALEPVPAVETMGAMLLGAHFAGAAIEASMLGAAHAAANPLTARFGIVHGQAVALMLPQVVRWNGAEVSATYARLVGEGPRAAERLALRLEELRRQAGLPERLSALGIAREELPRLAARAAREWTGTFNPRPVGLAEFLGLYEAAY
ncbi:MAG TPA: iron-containing alcohol dehydrogenase [Thermoanaerobaculia bacterium]|nr:iron-containing alcohol dehydrogenase [Thermoanaerobaculia bacterium]